MKARKKELDVDFIGGTSPLTKEEEKRISDILKSHKAKPRLTTQRPKIKVTSKKRVTT